MLSNQAARLEADLASANIEKATMASAKVKAEEEIKMLRKQVEREAKIVEDAQASKGHELKEDEVLAKIEKELTQSKEKLNIVTFDVTYGFYASAKRQFKVEVKPDFLKKECVVASIFAYC